MNTSKIYITVLLAFLGLSMTAYSQQEKFEPSGSAFGKVFFNYHYDLTQDATQTSQFELLRSYLGYKYNLSENISTKITLDVGKNSADKGSDYTAYLKIAQVDWQATPMLKFTAGLMGAKQFDDQEKHWGYRYLLKSAMDEYSIGASAVMGFNTEIKWNDFLTSDIFITNGEGYKSLQDNYGTQKYGANIVAKPIDGLTLKVYGDANFRKYGYNNDSLIVDTSTIYTYAFFAGYKTDDFRFGAEYNKLINGTKYNHAAEGHEYSTWCFYGTYIINPKFEVFGRYTLLDSKDDNGDRWYSKDGNVYTFGAQATITDGLKASLNYRYHKFATPETNDRQMVYLNLEYKF